MEAFISEAQKVGQATWPYLVAGLSLGPVGWFSTEFLARPIRRFFDLRGQIKRSMILVWEAPESGRQSPEEWATRMAPFIAERDALTMQSAELSAFAQSERFANWFVRLLRYDAIRAAKAAKKLAFELGTNVEERDKNYRSLDTALKFSFNAQRPFYNAYDPRR